MNLRKGQEFVKNPLREDVWGILGNNDEEEEEEENEDEGTLEDEEMEEE